MVSLEVVGIITLFIIGAIFPRLLLAYFGTMLLNWHHDPWLMGASTILCIVGLAIDFWINTKLLKEFL